MNLSQKSACALALGGLLSGSIASAQFGAGPAELSLVEVRDNVYMIFNEAVPGNATAIITDDGVLLVDNKYAIDYDNIMTELRKVTDQPIKYVINTHYHGDHSGSNALMQADGSQVIAANNARVKMVEAGQSGLPDITLEDHLRVYIGDVPVDAYYFGRSHTDGDVVVHLPDQSLVIMGDMYTHGQGLPQLIDYPGGGSARAWTKSVDGVLGLNFETVIPGHGTVTDRAALEAFRDDTVRLQETIQEMQRSQRSAADIEAVMRSEFGWEDFHVGMSLSGLLIELQ